MKEFVATYESGAVINFKVQGNNGTSAERVLQNLHNRNYIISSDKKYVDLEKAIAIEYVERR